MTFTAGTRFRPYETLTGLFAALFAVAPAVMGQSSAPQKHGIVFAKDRPFVLYVMTTYLKSERAGEEAISRIAAAAWATFDRLGRAAEFGRVVAPK